MANVITDNRTIVATADILDPTGAGQWTDEAFAVMSIALNTDSFIEGSSSVSDRFSGSAGSSEGGIGWDYEANTDLSGNVMYIWAAFADPSVLETEANGGMAVRFMGASASDFFQVNVGGVDTYFGGFKMFVIDVDLAAANPDLTGGTPPTTDIINWVGVQFHTQASAPGAADNALVDHIWTLPANTPGILVEGDNAGIPWNWQDIVDASDVNDTAKAWGTVRQDSGVIFLNTPIQFGVDEVSDADAFSDVGVVVVWENNLVQPNFYGLSNAANAAQTATFQLGTKIGSGATATGVNGGAILTGGPRWHLRMNEADFDSNDWYGVSFQGLGDIDVNNALNEFISCVFVDCDTIEMNGTSGPIFLSSFFSTAPGPRAQIVWTDETSPSATQFDFNGFVSMSWFALDIGSGMTADFTFDLRENFFSNNGTNRDILASHADDTLTINSSAATLPAGTNGSDFTILMSLPVDVLLYTIATWDEVDQTDAYAGATVSQGTGTLAQLQHASVYDTDDDSFAVAAARVPALAEILFDQAGDTYDDDIAFDRATDFLSARIGLDNITPSSSTREQDPSHSAAETETAQIIVEIDADTASTPVSLVAPGWRPWVRDENTLSASFTYGAGNDADNPKRRTFLVVVALDGSSATATSVLSAAINTVAGSTNFDDVADILDDNTGGGGSTSALRISVLDLNDGTGGANLGQGTLTIQTTVTVEVNGVTEGAQCYMEADAGGPLGEGTLIMNEAADSSGVASAAFAGITPQGVVIKARSSGTVGGVISDEDGVAVTDQTEAARDRSTTDDINLMPGGGTADILYIGAIDKFERVNFDIETIGVGAYTLIWEYSQGGDTWAALTVVDNTGDFKNAGCSRVTFTAPGDWATDTVTSDTGGVGPFFFIRARGDGGGQSTEPLGNTISVAEGNTVKYLPFESTGTIVAGTGLTVTAVWIPDVIAS